MDSLNGNKTQLLALISLLDEPDNGIFGKVRDQIFSFGNLAVPMLENAWESTFDTFLQKRIEDIINICNPVMIFSDNNIENINNACKSYSSYSKFQRKALT